MQRIIFCTAVILLCFMPVYAELVMPQYEASGAASLDSYIDGAREFDKSFSFDLAARDLLTGKSENPSSVAGKIADFFLGEVKENISLCMSILLISLCLGVMTNFVPESEKIFDTAFYVCYMVIFTLGIKTLENGIETGRKAIESMNFFMQAAVPVLGGLMAASGGVSRTMLISGAVVGISTVMTMFISYLFPLCRISALLGGVNNLTPEFNVKGLTSAIHKAVLWCLGIFMVVFSAILAVQGFAAVNLDNVAGKTVKYIAGSMVPIVGGVVADTIGNILACGKTVKAAAGGAGVLAMMYICLAPVLRITALLITYRLSVIVISPVADKRICGIIEDFSLVLKMILSLVICSGIMFIICIGIIAAI